MPLLILTWLDRRQEVAAETKPRDPRTTSLTNYDVMQYMLIDPLTFTCNY